MKTLVIVDMQHDFMVGGILEVDDSILLVDPIIAEAKKHDLVVATRDWHPPDHWSFKDNGGIWPKHCVAGTWQAQIYPEIEKIAHAVFNKGYSNEDEGYSVVENPVFVNAIRDSMEVTVCGVALDYCVRATAIDLAGYGFKVNVPANLTKKIEQDTALSAIAEMEKAGVKYERR